MGRFLGIEFHFQQCQATREQLTTLKPGCLAMESLLLGDPAPCCLSRFRRSRSLGTCFMHHGEGHRGHRGAGGGVTLVRLVTCTHPPLLKGGLVQATSEVSRLSFHALWWVRTPLFAGFCWPSRVISSLCSAQDFPTESPASWETPVPLADWDGWSPYLWRRHSWVGATYRVSPKRTPKACWTTDFLLWQFLEFLLCRKAVVLIYIFWRGVVTGREAFASI